MKANELRIGNYVYYNDDNDILIIKMIRNRDYDFYPIPLTEDWLLKFGFEDNKYNDQILIIPFRTASQGNFPGEWEVILLASAPYSLRHRIKYVHQLQNLYFEFFDEELTI